MNDKRTPTKPSKPVDADPEAAVERPEEPPKVVEEEIEQGPHPASLAREIRPEKRDTAPRRSSTLYIALLAAVILVAIVLGFGIFAGI